MVSLALIALYGAIWLGCRPSHFVVSPGSLEIVFPCWRRSLPMADVSGIRLINPVALRQEFGWAARIGVGGLWGGFGWLWTSRQGLLEFYVSRLDGLVLIERRLGKDLLITPECPSRFVRRVQEILFRPGPEL